MMWWKKRLRRADVYSFSESILLHALSETDDGLWIFSEPSFRLLASCTNTELGEAAMAALSKSKTKVPHPTSFDKLFIPFLKLAGVKSYKVFSAGAACVGIRVVDDELFVVPSKNLGYRDGFVDRKESVKAIKYSSDSAVLGQTIREALVIAEDDR